MLKREDVLGAISTTIGKSKWGNNPYVSGWYVGLTTLQTYIAKLPDEPCYSKDEVVQLLREAVEQVESEAGEYSRRALGANEMLSHFMCRLSQDCAEHNPSTPGLNEIGLL